MKLRKPEKSVECLRLVSFFLCSLLNTVAPGLTLFVSLPAFTDDAVQQKVLVMSTGPEKNACPNQLEIYEINTDIMVIGNSRLCDWLLRFENNNWGEFYLTDIVAMAVVEGIEVRPAQPTDSFGVMGVNDRTQLTQLERRPNGLRLRS